MMSKNKINEIVRRYPQMQPIIEFEGTVKEFYDQYSLPYKAMDLGRRDFFIQAVKDAAGHAFSNGDCDLIEMGLKKNYLISSAEHHASISYNETLNIVLNQYLIQRYHNSPLISLSCATTTLNNELYPRGIFYKNHKIAFTPKRPVFAYNSQSIILENFISKINNLRCDNEISEEEHFFLKVWFIKEFEKLANHSFVDQISILNYDLWQSFLSDSVKYPGLNYYMIPVENVVHNLLIMDYNSANPSWVFRLLFNTESLDKMKQAFNGLRSCWDVEKKIGTFFFWGFKENGRPVRLFLKGSYLVSECGSIQIKFDADNIIDNIKKKIIVTSSTLFFLYVVFYCGVTTLGGILQVNYLTKLKQRILDNNPLQLSDYDQKIICQTSTNLYANFQASRWVNGGIDIIRRKLSCTDIRDYESQIHYDQIQECLNFLYNFSY